jgi:arylsulfatase A-like enzyme
MILLVLWPTLLLADQPNVVIILADDLGYADVGYHGCADIPTPHIDQLAASGVRCTSGYSSHPYCSPMRAGMMSARYQHRFGYERNIAYDPQNRFMGIPARVSTIAARLKQVGYSTGLLGKWHLGAAHPFHPNHRGYDYFCGFLGGGHQYFEVNLMRPMGEGYFSPLQRNGAAVNLAEYLTTFLSNEAVGFIERRQDEPFFLFVSYNAPHTPMQAPESRIEEFSSIQDRKRRSYAAMVSVLDDGVGQIVRQLTALKLREKTLIFFLSDNGGPEHANASLNDPLRGQKGNVYEGGIRVPFIASWPGTLPGGQEYAHPVNSIDASCTALALAGIDLQKAKLDGVNLIPFLAGETDEPPHEGLFWRKDNGEEWAVRSGSLKLLKTKDATSLELYDLDADIGETTNLAATRPADVERLKGLFERWNADNIPPFFVSYSEYHRRMNAKYRELEEETKAENLDGAGEAKTATGR